MGFDLSEFIQCNRSLIIAEWADRLHAEVGEQYSRRPHKELVGTVTGAFDANTHVLLHNDFSYINRFINKITRMRLESGFLLSDVQKAFELYRTIMFPLLANAANVGDFHNAISKINKCLAYTIHRFSDLFQNMHEKEIMEYAQRLEGEVKDRTAELKESELKYKTLVEEINDGYFVIQKEAIVFANKAFCQMHGYKQEEVIGQKFYLFIAPENQQKVIEIYADSLNRRRSHPIFEYKRLTKDGHRFPTEIMAKVIRYENQMSNIGICRDITKRVEMEQRIREAERMAYIGQITTSLSHEIRNPLSAVKMNIQILNKNPQLRGNDQRRVEISIKEVLRLERILTELLDFAKPLQFEFRPCYVNQILFACEELLEMKFKEKELSPFFCLAPEISEIMADKEKLEQAFINLLLNTIEACRERGEILVTSRSGLCDGKPTVEVIVEDDGPGIPRKHMEDIFKPFFTTRSNGTGLGLANVKRIVEAHGGWIKAQNRDPSGASFHIYLPSGGGNA
ncbi:MAG: PAS domain S-box protein [Syntrophales bacterium]